MTTHDLTPHLPLLRSEAGREILGDTWLQEHPGGQFIVSHGVYWKAGAVPLDVYHAIAFRALRWSDENGPPPAFEGDRGETIFNADPHTILAEAARVAGVERPSLADSTERTEVTTGPRTKTTSIVLNERGRDSVSVEGGEGVSRTKVVDWLPILTHPEHGSAILDLAGCDIDRDPADYGGSGGWVLVAAGGSGNVEFTFVADEDLPTTVENAISLGCHLWREQENGTGWTVEFVEFEWSLLERNGDNIEAWMTFSRFADAIREATMFDLRVGKYGDPAP